MTATFDHSYAVRHGTDDASAEVRQAREAERDHHERVAAVRVTAGLARGATEAREFFAMLGLSDAEIREARRSVIAMPTAAAAAARRRGRFGAA